MLKTLSLSREDSDPDGPDSGHSESRMRRALEALSSQPVPADPTDAADTGQGADTGSDPEAGRLDGHGSGRPRRDQFGREFGGFRPKAPQLREPFRNDAAPHPKPRHRFVKDGEVTVVHMPVPRPRDAAAGRPEGDQARDQARLSQSLEEWRQRGEQAERMVADLQNQLRTAQAKAAHAEMALTEAQALAEARLQELAALHSHVADPAPAAVQPAVQPAAPAKRPVGRPRLIRPEAPPLPVPGGPVQALPAPAVSQPKLSQPRMSQPRMTQPIVSAPLPPPVDAQPADEPEPVEWWLLPPPGGAKRKRRARSSR